MILGVILLVPFWIEIRNIARMLCPLGMLERKRRILTIYILSTIQVFMATICVLIRIYDSEKKISSYSELYSHLALSYFFYDLINLYLENNKHKIVFTIHHIACIILLIYFLQDVTICPIIVTAMIALEIPVLTENAYQIARLFYPKSNVLKPLTYVRFFSYFYIRIWYFWHSYQEEKIGKQCEAINKMQSAYYFGWILFAMQWIFLISMGRDLLRTLQIPSSENH